MAENEKKSAEIETKEGTMLVAIATIGDEKFESLFDAIDAAEDGDVVVLRKSIELSTTIVIDKDITLDLYNRTLTFIAPENDTAPGSSIR